MQAVAINLPHLHQQPHQLMHQISKSESLEGFFTKNNHKYFGLEGSLKNNNSSTCSSKMFRDNTNPAVANGDTNNNISSTSPKPGQNNNNNNNSNLQRFLPQQQYQYGINLFQHKQPATTVTSTSSSPSVVSGATAVPKQNSTNDYATTQSMMFWHNQGLTGGNIYQSSPLQYPELAQIPMMFGMNSAYWNPQLAFIAAQQQQQQLMLGQMSGYNDKNPNLVSMQNYFQVPQPANLFFQQQQQKLTLGHSGSNIISSRQNSQSTTTSDTSLADSTKSMKRKLSVDDEKLSRKKMKKNQSTNKDDEENDENENDDDDDHDDDDDGYSSEFSSSDGKKKKTSSNSGKSNSSSSKYWTKEQERELLLAAEVHGANQWDDVALAIPGKSANECERKWNALTGIVEIRKGPWAAMEDKILLDLVQKQIEKERQKLLGTIPTNANSSSTKVTEPIRINWRQVANEIPGRSAKQSRARWVNNLDPSLRKGNWTDDEDQTILRLYKEYGSRWATIAQKLDGRSENSVKIRHITLTRRLKGTSNSFSSSFQSKSSDNPAVATSTNKTMPTTNTPASLSSSSNTLDNNTHETENLIASSTI